MSSVAAPEVNNKPPAIGRVDLVRMTDVTTATIGAAAAAATA